jgi:hypothetical protein
MSLSKIWNLKHKYRATRAQFLKKVDGAQSSIEKNLHHQKILVVESNASLKGPKKTPMILNP